MNNKEMLDELRDLTLIGMLEETKEGEFRLGPLHHQLAEKVRNNIPFTQAERDKLRLINMRPEIVIRFMRALE